MIKSIGKLTLATILAALVVGVPLTMSAQDKTPAPASPDAPAKKAKGIPFGANHTTLAAVDKVNKTITLDDKSKHVLEVTSETKIMKNGKPATLDDGVVGEEVAGQYTKSADGKWVAKSIRFGAKPAPPTK